MSTDDPFFTGQDDGRTLLRPMPGGRPRAPGTPAPRIAQPSSAITVLPSSGLNPLVSAAQPLLTLVNQLRNTGSHPDPDGLRDQMVEQIKVFETSVRDKGIAGEVARTSRYILCTLIDETVLGTPWGSTSIWNKQGLLVTFHNEAWGGEKFFLLLDRFMRDANAHRDLLELMYICLALGLEGRYRVIDGGKARLDELRAQLFLTLRSRRDEFERELSPHWQGVVDRRNPLIRHVPLWVLGSVVSALLLALYLGFSYALNRSSDPVFSALHHLDRELPKVLIERRPQAPKPGVQPFGATLRGLLAPDIRQGLLDVVDDPNGEKVVIRGDGLFGSGSATVEPRHDALLKRIAQALSAVPGAVLVTGHTDNVPIRLNARFPSNWHLSQARAEAVVKMLAAETGTPVRFAAEGRADTEPLAENTTRENRARNRRVEILLRRHGVLPSTDNPSS